MNENMAIYKKLILTGKLVKALILTSVIRYLDRQKIDGFFYKRLNDISHTIYTRNNMGQKCEGNCGLWVLNEILKKTYPGNLKKMGWIGCAI